MSAPELREVIDRVLAAEKTLAGVPRWEPEDRKEGVVRWVANVLVNDELTGLALIIKAYPTTSELKFRIILTQDKAIWRLDFAHDKPHTNSFNAPSDLGGLVIAGNHYHAWADNRRFCSTKSLPKELQNARQLPTNIRTFENAYRWFCGETRIVGVDTFGIPSLPKRTTLL